VLQVLFAADALNEDPVHTLVFLQRHFGKENDEELKIHRVMSEFAQELVEAVQDEGASIDRLISSLSHHWKLYRISRVDRNILRMAIAEFIHFPEIPGKVILNEAIEIGKKYGAENSHSFINGILDRIQRLPHRPSNPDELSRLLSELDVSDSTS
jgi:transcription antitermination protein NusB